MIDNNKELFNKNLSFDQMIQKMGGSVAIPDRFSVKVRESM